MALSTMFKWEVVDPAPGEAVAPHHALGTILVIDFFHLVKGRQGDGAGTVTKSL